MPAALEETFEIIERKGEKKMAKNPRVNETLQKARRAESVWQTIPEFKLGTVSLNDFMATMNAADALTKQHANNAVEGAGLKANRDDKVRELNDLVVRFLTGIHSSYGPDSPLYEQAGGTRPSSRKSPKRQGETASALSTSTSQAPATPVPDTATPPATPAVATAQHT